MEVLEIKLHREYKMQKKESYQLVREMESVCGGGNVPI
jgi:hypothetical protein